jgi:hypothetical protein
MVLIAQPRLLPLPLMIMFFEFVDQIQGVSDGPPQPVERVDHKYVAGSGVARPVTPRDPWWPRTFYPRRPFRCRRPPMRPAAGRILFHR